VRGVVRYTPQRDCHVRTLALRGMAGCTSTVGFWHVTGLQKLVERTAIAAKMPFKVHPHMLRHATGYALANRGTDTRTLQAYLGHRSIQSTVRYTELAPGRFKNLWR
jgi:site-specific recombinase XerD